MLDGDLKNSGPGFPRFGFAIAPVYFDRFFNSPARAYGPGAWLKMEFL
jgi:hypothetical protein